MIGISSKITELALGGEREKLVCVIRERFGGSQAYKPRLDVRDLCQKVGIPITESTFAGAGALAVRDVKGRIDVAIALDSTLPAEEQRFTLAHLLGHFFLHVQPKLAAGEWHLDGFKEMHSAQGRYVNRVVMRGMRVEDRQRDGEADAFAAALLMPMGPLKRALEKLGDPDHVAAFFGVSPQVLARRLEDLSGAEPEPRSFSEAEDHLERVSKPTGRVLKASQNSPGAVSADALKPGKVDLTNVQRVMAKASYKSDGPAPAKVTGDAAKVKEPRAAKPKEASGTKAKAPARAKSKDPSDVKVAPAVDSPKKPRKGMEMLRDLARKIDSSVD